VALFKVTYPAKGSAKEGDEGCDMTPAPKMFYLSFGSKQVHKSYV